MIDVYCLEELLRTTENDNRIARDINLQVTYVSMKGLFGHGMGSLPPDEYPAIVPSRQLEVPLEARLARVFALESRTWVFEPRLIAHSFSCGIVQ